MFTVGRLSDQHCICAIKGFILLFSVALLSAPATLGHGAEVLQSPDGAIEMEISSDPQIGFQLTMDGKPIAEIRELNIYIDGVGLGSVKDKSKPNVVSISKGTEFKQLYSRFGPHQTATNHYKQYVVQVESIAGQRWSIEVRLFDDGAAYRLSVPLEGEHRIEGDYAAWSFGNNARIWQQDANNRSYEDEYWCSQIGKLGKGYRFMMPATVELPEGQGYAMITEANLLHYCDLVLEVSEQHEFRHVFRDNFGGWRHTGRVLTPWRTVIVCRDLNALVNSDVIMNLCPPVGDSLCNADWIRPGRCLWHWLTTGHPKVEDQKPWIDGASELGWEYYLIDDGWCDWNGGGDSAWATLAALSEYAIEREVRLWAWVHSKELRTHEQRKAYFQRAQDIGLAGLKIDFPDPANRDWVNWYDATLKDAADAKLLINFHGAVKPTGRERVWPHELTREAIRGREQGKLPATHDTALPFVRYVQGHADYTPTLLVPGRLRGSTLAHELAMAVVYTSPLLCMGDSYENYLKSEAVDVLKMLPCTWDETIVLPGSEIGSLSAFARRHGDRWFIGVIGGSKGRTLEIDTGFLSEQQYECIELADKPGENAAFSRSERVASREDKLVVHLSPDGGYVACLQPLGKVSPVIQQRLSH